MEEKYKEMLRDIIFDIEREIAEENHGPFHPLSEIVGKLDDVLYTVQQDEEDAE